MKPADDRFRRVEALYYEMLSRPVHERPAALIAACPGDPALAAEVQSLLDQPQSAAGFFASPAVDMAARLVSDARSSLTGQRIGVFEVLDLLGVGGMGEVYRARDTRLGRDVAIKVLPEAFARDESRLSRFNREARALAALNHPNIAAIYGVEELSSVSGRGPGSLAIVMEFIPGEELSARIARGALPITEALPIARQIAKALDAAHEQNIVHRDLKPANIKVRADGTVKVLDFGLAKTQPVSTAEDTTRTMEHLTGDGGVMGTPGYMSPEQIRGQRVDWRSDLFSFGVVLYEMLSGRRAFAKASGAETMSATLSETLPDLHAVAPGTDPALAMVVARCLAKRPENRFQSAKDLGFALETVSATSGPRPSIQPSWRKWRVAAVAIVLVAAVALAGVLISKRERALVPATFRQVTSDGHSVTGDISPDGETIAYVSTGGEAWRLMVRDLAGEAPVELYRSERIYTPRWSHSGRQIAVSTNDEILVFPRFGGEPIRIATRAYRISWSPDDSELILGRLIGNSFWTAAIRTREVRQVEWDASFPGGFVSDVSPDGERLLWCAWGPERGGVWSMRRDGTDLRQHVREVRRTQDARWAENGASFYYLLQGTNVSEIRRARVLSNGMDPTPATTQDNLTIQDSSAASIGTSRTGRLVFPRATFDRNLWRADINPSLSSSDPIPLRAVTTGARNEDPRFSPDGARIVFSRHDGELGQLLVASSEGEIQKTLVSRKGLTEEPAWSPDGESVAYVLDEDDGGRVMHVVNVRSGEDRTFGPAGAPATPEWMPGTRLLYVGPDRSTYILDPVTGKKAPLIEGEYPTQHLFPRYSRRGDRIALYYDARRKKGGVGLATISLHDNSVRIISDPGTSAIPIGWSADDAVVYGIESNRLRAFRSDGSGLRTMGTLPSRLTFGEALEIGGKLKLVFYYPNDRSDLWVVDNFDGGRR